MKNLYLSTDELDKRCETEFGLSEAILMENAATALEFEVRKRLTKGSKILAVCGSGNNGADAICALRKLTGEYECYALFVSKNQNNMSKYQLNIAQKVGTNLTQNLESNLDGFDCIIDGIFGSGFKGMMSDEICELIDRLNTQKALKIAVDVPSGINRLGQVNQTAFKSDIVISMGALKFGLFLDEAKDFVGEVMVANLGVNNSKFEITSEFKLLEKSDMKLPFRTKSNTNKSDFGHTFVVSGQMNGAAVIAGLSASAIGSGLVSLVSSEKIANLDPILMKKDSLKEAKIVVAGCGLGESKFELMELAEKTCVIDADLCYKKDIVNLVENNPNLVLTPHPKEFASLLNLAGIANITVSELQKNRFKFAKSWSEKFRSVLVLKGANTIIAQDGQIYVMAEGSSVLAKGGSGDVLSGLIAGLLAQNYRPLNAAITGTLAHALAAQKFNQNSYALTPYDIIEGVKCL